MFFKNQINIHKKKTCRNAQIARQSVDPAAGSKNKLKTKVRQKLTHYSEAKISQHFDLH